MSTAIKSIVVTLNARAFRLQAYNKRSARVSAKLERIRERATVADNLARTLRHEGKPELAAYWTSLRDVYYRAHDRVIATRVL